MKTLILILFSTFILVANDGLPKRVQTTIQNINKNGYITLSNPIPKGRSGIIIHSYGNELFAITHTAISLGGTKASVSEYNMLKHKNLPTIKTPIKVGDKVIFGNLYNNVMLIAPDEQSYSSITKSIKRVWIHPDMYASFLLNNDKDTITLKNLKEFAIETQVGLVVILAKDGLRVLDPISGKYLRRLPNIHYISKNPQSPFYARFEQIKSNIFSADTKSDFLPYYKGIERIK